MALRLFSRSLLRPSYLAANASNIPDNKSISTTNWLQSKDIFKPANVFETARKYSEKKSKEKFDTNSDSDSDDEIKRSKTKGSRGNSKFWRQKMRTLHGIMDINHDGVISYEDFMLLAEKFGALGHFTPEGLEEFREVMKSTWEEQWGEITPYNMITVEMFLIEMHHSINDKDLVHKVHRFLPFLFRAVDKDHSGEISITEFKLFFKCLGLTDKDAVTAFAVIDKNCDGLLSIKEFVKLGRDFFLTEDDKKISKYFWGPLLKDN